MVKFILNIVSQPVLDYVLLNIRVRVRVRSKRKGWHTPQQIVPFHKTCHSATHSSFYPHLK